MLTGLTDIFLQLANPMSWAVAFIAFLVGVLIFNSLCMTVILMERYARRKLYVVWGLLVVLVMPLIFWLAGVLGWAFAFLITG